MSEKPILFSGEMIRAILEGRKTQTRRIIKPRPTSYMDGWTFDNDYFLSDDDMRSYLWHNVYGAKGSPYGAVYADGSFDTMWVRETFAWVADTFGITPGVVYKADGLIRWNISPKDGETVYNADNRSCWKYKPSIFMPRKASRITLKITDVRIERLNQITEADAIAEGTTPSIVGQDLDYLRYRAGYQTLWERINGAGSWDDNPWVWVVSFEQVAP